MAWAAPFTHPITVAPVGIGNEIVDDESSIPGSIYAVDGKPGDAGRALRCIDPESGAERWQLSVGAEAAGRPVSRARSTMSRRTGSDITS